MAKYKVCDLVLDMSPRYSELGDRASLFLCEDKDADAFISLPEDEVTAQATRSGLDMPMAEYQLGSVKFCKALLGVGGFVLHASAVMYKGGVYLFSAPSGVGKSTHTRLWTETLDGARVINDDKPGIRIIDGVPYAYGTPWCGSGYLRTAEKGVIKALYFIRRNSFNHVKPMPADKVPYLFFESTMRPACKEEMDALFAVLDAFASKVPIFSLDCNMDKEAVFTALSAVEN